MLQTYSSESYLHAAETGTSHSAGCSFQVLTLITGSVGRGCMFAQPKQEQIMSEAKETAH